MAGKSPEPQRVALLGLAWDYANNASLRLETEYARLQNPYSFGVVRMNGVILYDKSYVDPRASSERDYLRNSLYWVQGLGDNWQIAASGSYGTMDRQDTMMGFYYKLNEEQLLGYWGNPDNQARQSSGKLELSGSFTTATLSHQLTLGAEYNKLDNRLARLISTGFTLDPHNPDFDRPIPIEGAVSRPFHLRDREQHLYLLDTIDITGQLSLTLGLRHSEFASHNRLTDTYASDHTTLASLAGLNWQLAPVISLYANHARSYEPNSGIDKQGEFFDPRDATQTEVGARYQPHERLGLQLSLYQLEQHKLLTRDPLDRDYLIPTGARRTRGIELESSLAIHQSLQLKASYSHLKNEVIEDFYGLLGKTTSGVPRNLGSLRLDWQPSGVYQASIGLTGVGKRYGDASNSFSLPGYARLDAGIAANWQHLGLRLSIENLLDKRYIAAPFAEDDLYQGKRRELILGLSYRW
jgi:iron complex outermembrane receptor protein